MPNQPERRFYRKFRFNGVCVKQARRKGARAVAGLLLLSGCEQVLTRTADYDPTQVGSVDQALCFLGYTAVPVREALTGHHLVDVTLNGRQATFILDTGANATVLHAPLAGEFGLEGSAAPAGAIGIGGAVQARQARVDNFALSDIPLRQRRIMLADLSQATVLLSRLTGTRVAGILGQDAMKAHDAVIDIAKPMLYLTSAERPSSPAQSEDCAGHEDRVAASASREPVSSDVSEGRRQTKPR